MIEYAGAPALGEYVIIKVEKNSNFPWIYKVVAIRQRVDEKTQYELDNTGVFWSADDLIRVKPEWNVGELVRYKGRVHQILIIEVKNYKFVYSLEDINQWIAEDELEEVNSIRYMLRPNNWFEVNKYCINEQFRGMKGRINIVSHLGANCFLRGIGPESYDISWEAIDAVEKKVEPYNVELICIEGEGEWKKGALAEIIDGVLYYQSDGMRYKYPWSNFNNIEDVNNSFTTVRFAEIKETIGDKEGWSGKFYVADTTADGLLKVGNIYVVKKGILNIGRCFSMQIFTSFEDIQERFNYATLIEVKE